MNEDSKKEVYLKEEIDEKKLDFNPDWIMKESDTEEDKEFVREQRKKHGITDEMINSEIEKINADSSNYYDDVYYDSFLIDDEESESLVPIDQVKIVEEKREEKTEIEKILGKAEKQRFDNELKAHSTYHLQTLKNKFLVQSTYEHNVNKYEASESFKRYKADLEEKKFNNLVYESKKLISKVNIDGSFCLWKYKKNFYLRTDENNVPDKYNKSELSEQLTDFFSEPIQVVNIKDLTKNKNIEHDRINKYIFEHQVPFVEKEVFELNNENEFFEINNILYRNLFTYTSHLKKRFNTIQKKSYFDNFVIDFIEVITNESDMDDKTKPITSQIIHWISYFFQKLESSNIALVLLGSKEITEGIFWKRIIQPIFGNENTCITIDDEELKKEVSKIVKNKIFLHIGDFTYNDNNISKIKQILEATFIDGYVIDSKTKKQIPIHAQILITSEVAVSYLKSFNSRFQNVNICDSSTIMLKLDVFDETDLAIKVKACLDVFSDDLPIIFKNSGMPSIVKQEIDVKQDDEESVDYSDQIDKFINAFKSKKEDFLKYFEAMKEDEKFYNQLVSAYEEGYYISQDLYTYFTKIYENHIYSNKAQFIKELREKDDMFKQEIDTLKALDDNTVEVELFKAYKTSKEFDYKKLAKIKEYKLSENIKIPKGFIILNREGNARFKYEYEDLETAKKMYAKYDKEQLEKKQETK